MVQKVFENLLSCQGIQLYGKHALLYIVQLQPELFLCNQIGIHGNSLRAIFRTVFGECQGAHRRFRINVNVRVEDSAYPDRSQ